MTTTYADDDDGRGYEDDLLDWLLADERDQSERDDEARRRDD
jgi:hypothetical protein